MRVKMYISRCSSPTLRQLPYGYFRYFRMLLDRSVLPVVNRNQDSGAAEWLEGLSRIRKRTRLALDDRLS